MRIDINEVGEVDQKEPRIDGTMILKKEKDREKKNTKEEKCVYEKKTKEKKKEDHCVEKKRGCE
jgi:hypothetical protein